MTSRGDAIVVSLPVETPFGQPRRVPSNGDAVTVLPSVDPFAPSHVPSKNNEQSVDDGGDARRNITILPSVNPFAPSRRGRLEEETLSDEERDEESDNDGRDDLISLPSFNPFASNETSHGGRRVGRPGARRSPHRRVDAQSGDDSDEFEGPSRRGPTVDLPNANPFGAPLVNHGRADRLARKDDDERHGLGVVNLPSVNPFTAGGGRARHRISNEDEDED
ncbi:hypothetical protein RSOL_286070, partial [Rhizoctonia solani AG-3 Rhs1AP]